jgi:CP family cyanate transporter-like MFS transporter
MILDGLLISLSGIGLVTTPPALATLWCGLLGFSAALIFVLNLALPPLLAAPEDVHRLSAGIFSISYTCAFLGPLIGGAIWDATGAPGGAFLPAIVAAVVMTWLAMTVDLTRAKGSRREPAAV